MKRLIAYKGRIPIIEVDYEGNKIIDIRCKEDENRFKDELAKEHITQGQWYLPSNSPQNAMWVMSILGYDVKGDIIYPSGNKDAVY